MNISMIQYIYEDNFSEELQNMLFSFNSYFYIFGIPITQFLIIGH